MPEMCVYFLTSNRKGVELDERISEAELEGVRGGKKQ